MNKFMKFSLITFMLISCGQFTSNGKNDLNPVLASQTDECDDPDADIACSFIGMPKSLSSVMTIANDAGQRLSLSGTIFKSDGKTPFPGVILYAYHTDDKGYYSKSGNEKGIQKWHGRLHGWCKTDKDGRYEINTIRPAPYPNNKIPAHIHPAVKVPGTSSPYYLSDFVFSDDPLIDDRYAESIKDMPGGTGIVELKKINGEWVGKRNITLKP